MVPVRDPVAVLVQRSVQSFWWFWPLWPLAKNGTAVAFRLVMASQAIFLTLVGREELVERGSWLAVFMDNPPVFKMSEVSPIVACWPLVATSPNWCSISLFSPSASSSESPQLASSLVDPAEHESWWACGGEPPSPAELLAHDPR